MFGPGIDHALEQYSCPDRELLAVLQLFRTQRQILFRFAIEPAQRLQRSPSSYPLGGRECRRSTTIPS